MSIKLVLAQDVDWPPYAYYSVPPEGDYTLAGFGRDVARGLSSVCPDLEVTTVQTKWSDCWSQGHIGGGLLGAHFHACMTYTHTKGETRLPRVFELDPQGQQAGRPDHEATTARPSLADVRPVRRQGRRRARLGMTADGSSS